MRMTAIPIIIGALGTAPKDLERELEVWEIGERIETIQNYSIVKIGQNTEKSPGYLRRLAVIESSVKKKTIG